MTDFHRLPLRLPLRCTALALAAAATLHTAHASPDSDAVLQAWPARAPVRDAALEARVEAALKTLTVRQKVGQITQPLSLIHI